MKMVGNRAPDLIFEEDDVVDIDRHAKKIEGRGLPACLLSLPITRHSTLSWSPGYTDRPVSRLQRITLSGFARASSCSHSFNSHTHPYIHSNTAYNHT